MKPWEHIENHLINKDCTIYFAGGTLCVDVPKKSTVCVNLDGRGFILNFSLKKSHVYAPKRIVELVREIYKSVKGETPYFHEKVNRLDQIPLVSVS